MSNSPTGYHAFKSVIDEAAEALGARSREALAYDASEVLRRTLIQRFALDNYARPSWTLASDLHFEEAAQIARRRFTARPCAVLASVLLGPAELVLFSDVNSVARVDLTGGGFSLDIILTSEHSGYDTRTRGNVTKWSPFVTHTGCRVASGEDTTYVSAAGNKSVTCKTQGATFKSARGLIKDYFKVEMIDLPKAGTA